MFGPILANPSVFVNGVELNLGTTRTQGVDFLGNYSIPTDHSGTFLVGLTGTYTFKYDVQFTPGGPRFGELNNIGFPLRLRMRGSVGWNDGPISTLVFVNYENGYNNTEVTPRQPISSYHHRRSERDLRSRQGVPGRMGQGLESARPTWTISSIKILLM